MAPQESTSLPSPLLWSIVRNQNAFLIKRPRVQFTREPGNLLNLNSYKFSGLAHAQTIDVKPAPEKGTQVVVSKKAAMHQPAKKTVATTFKYQGVRRIAKTVKGLAKNGYRPDLEKAALARASAVVKSQKPVKATKNTKKGRRAAKKA